MEQQYITRLAEAYKRGYEKKYVGMKNNRHIVKANKGFSLIGYTKMDLGIAKLHFEIGAGKKNFEWV